MLRFTAVIVIFCLAVLLNHTVWAASLDISKIIKISELQKFVTKSTLILEKDTNSLGNTKYVYMDQQWKTMPLITIEAIEEKDPNAELDSKVKMVAKMFGGKVKQVSNIGDECYYDDSFGTYYFRKGKIVCTVGCAKLDYVNHLEIVKLISSRI